MNHVEDYITSGILEQFVLEQLATAEAREVQLMAERYPEVRREITLIEDTLRGVAEELAKAPPSHIFERIQAKISEEEPAPEETEEVLPKQEILAKKTKKIHYWQYGVAATFTLKLAFMAVAANFWMKWQNTESKLSNIQERYDQLAQDSRQLTQTLMTISDPAVQTVVLHGPPTDAGVRVLTYWNKDTRELLVNAASLPPNDSDQQYQLWGVVDDKSVSLGVFDVTTDASLPQVLSFSGPAGLSSLSIRLGPKGGSQAPPSAWYARGTIE